MDMQSMTITVWSENLNITLFNYLIFTEVLLRLINNDIVVYILHTIFNVKYKSYRDDTTDC